MSTAPIRLAIAVADPDLADRIAAVLGGVEGIELVGASDGADAVVTASVDEPNRHEPLQPDLTPREREVLALLAEGASNRSIAHRLGISIHTAKFHVGSLIAKLDAVGRTDVVAHAARLGVIRL